MAITKLASVAAIATTFAVGGLGLTGCSRTAQSPQATAPTTALTTTEAPAPRQTVLPFSGLEYPNDVAVDAAGNVYLTDVHHFTDDMGFAGTTSQVIELPAGSNAQRPLPFTHSTVTGDSAGAVWVVDARNEQLIKLAAGSEKQIVLPLPDLGLRSEVLTVDAAGNPYGIDGGGVEPGGGCCIPIHVVKADIGADAPTVLPFSHVDGLAGMAVDTAGNVYVGDANSDRVFKLAAGSNTPTELPFADLELADIAVDAVGSVYAVDTAHNRVLKLQPGADAQTVLPFTGLNHPVSVAVDTRGDVYVVDGANHRVVELEAAPNK